MREKQYSPGRIHRFRLELNGLGTNGLKINRRVSQLFVVKAELAIQLDTV